VCVTRDEFLRMKEAQSATDGAPTSVEHAVHLDADPRTVTENNDDTATNSPQVLVPANDLAAPANTTLQPTTLY
jgi:hypothetical protein